MTVINKSAIVPYTATQMFDLVNDIEQYSKFVPYCVNSKIVERSMDEIHAMLTFAGAGISKSFSTLNRLQPHKMIEMRLVNGPFKSLEGFWNFENLENHSSKVSLNLEFELAAGVLKIMFGPVFNQVASLLVDSFHKRAAEVYK
ncbi:MAG: type II toxin-antitoxin system RatA family toxin [Proteobacteria bacterium]|nr:type II toxin-antitoxin system RatA family toxin [Pseudomonadota bacterium]